VAPEINQFGRKWSESEWGLFAIMGALLFASLGSWWPAFGRLCAG